MVHIKLTYDGCRFDSVARLHLVFQLYAVVLFAFLNFNILIIYYCQILTLLGFYCKIQHI